MEDGPRDRREDTLALRGQIRRLQLQAFRREAERGGRDSRHLQKRPQDPDLRRLQIAEGSQEQKGEGQASFKAQEAMLRGAAPNRRQHTQLVRGGAAESHPPRGHRRRHGNRDGAFLRQGGNPQGLL